MGEEGEELRDHMVAKGGTWYDTGMSSLEVEARALLEVLEFVATLLR